MNIYVQRIQRHVRSWLIKRHKSEIKHASNIVTLSITSNPKKRKIDEKQAAIIIQRTVRAYLTSKISNH